MPLVDDLTAIGRAAHGSDAEPVVLYDRGGSLVVRIGDVVVKAHAERIDPDDLAARVGIAAEPGMRGILMAPLAGLSRVGDRLVTVWPAATTVDPDDLDAAPWTAAAGLLAMLHTARVTVSCVTAAGSCVTAAGRRLPPSSGPAGVARATARLAELAGPAADAVRQAGRALPPWASGSGNANWGTGAGGASGPRLIHGDWHFGQLAHLDGWHLIDVDDLGVGDPAWDLARPAALFAVGLLDPEVWWRFVADYQAAGGPAVPATGDPWAPLDASARALVVRLAAEAVVAADTERRDLDEIGELLVGACMRMNP